MQQAADGAAREEHARAASGPWWVQQGYPPFEEDEAGWPHAGQVVRYFRQRKRRPDGKCWTQADLARALGISERAVRNMEERKEGLDSISRRRFLAETLQIPPVLLGLAVAPAVPASSVAAGYAPESAAAHVSRFAVDYEQLQEQEERYWQEYHRGNATAALPRIQTTLQALYAQLPFAGSERFRTTRLLVSYHLLASAITRDQRAYSQAIEHASRAIELAQSLDHAELQAVALYRRQTVWLDARHRQLALQDAQQARGLLPSLPPWLQAAVLIRGGFSQAFAQGRVEGSRALREMEHGAALLQREPAPGDARAGHFLRMDLRRYRVDKGAALLEMGRPREALEVLPQQRRAGAARQSAFTDLLIAQAAIELGDYEMGAALALELVGPLRQIGSQVNLERARRLTERLAASPFGSAPEVARLRALLAGPRRGKPGPQSV
ncbi:MAG: helix-turn-helix transcriptional regulator [Thermogemmatispora sp.]|uniref:helix-turn-helix domain-containing protein n=1 Tax=Thermogemmatispora sp. TaxID=1968838 RepID=UPI001DC5AB44|nr:helix-turn-helix transcriptional regulator [Thermogemmatispora sp.]MBX5451966.1 helix-turn-helix transcriptional regulator [Thermogemmatispora sp.]